MPSATSEPSDSEEPTMQPPTIPPPPSRVLLRRYGPVIAILAVLGVVAGVLLSSQGGPKAAGTTPTAGGAHSAGAISWSQAAAEGKTKSIDWGSRCDTTTGRLKYPYYFAGQCYAPFKGNNGGATYPGVTAHSVKVVLYLPEPQDPVLRYIEGAIADTDTNQQRTETRPRDDRLLPHHY